MNKDEIIVKVITKGSHLVANRASSTKNSALPNHSSKLGRCRFVFGNEQKYDWLVVYDDFKGKIELNCPPENTLLVTSEPSSIKTYESVYTRQFGHVLTGQEDWALKHPGKIHSQPALFWFYGINDRQNLSFDQIANNPPLNKSKTISTVTSAKRQKHTLHNKRYQFIEKLQRRLPNWIALVKASARLTTKLKPWIPINTISRLKTIVAIIGGLKNCPMHSSGLPFLSTLERPMLPTIFRPKALLKLTSMT